MTKPISLAEPVSDLRRVPIRENREPLVNFLEACPRLLLDRPRFNYRREHLLRKGVAERLHQATLTLPEGYRIAIIEGWRAPHIQRRMYASFWQRMALKHPEWSHAKLTRFVNRFTAPMNPRVPPPHTTGAAMDVALTNDAGEPFSMTSAYEARDVKSFPFDAPGLTAEDRMHRQMLRDALGSAGITNYPSEYWHFSYGDQGWAYRGGHEAAIYGPITPEGWQPDPADAVDEPLVLLSDLESQ